VLAGTPDRHDGEWLRVTQYGSCTIKVRTVAELERYVSLAELEPHGLAPGAEAARVRMGPWPWPGRRRVPGAHSASLVRYSCSARAVTEDLGDLLMLVTVFGEDHRGACPLARPPSSSGRSCPPAHPIKNKTSLSTMLNPFTVCPKAFSPVHVIPSTFT
jgi:hypothetical protein